MPASRPHRGTPLIVRRKAPHVGVESQIWDSDRAQDPRGAGGLHGTRNHAGVPQRRKGTRMRPCVEAPFSVRGLEYGGAKPLFCVPLVAGNLPHLLAQAEAAHDLAADLVEWRADFYGDLTPATLVGALGRLRSVLAREPIIFTLRVRGEGGAQEISQETRRICIEGAAGSGVVDFVDLEISNDIPFLDSAVHFAHERGVRVLMSFHDFSGTPANAQLLEKIGIMNQRGADVAKIAVMPRAAADVLRLLEVTLEARRSFPRLPLCTLSMGRAGVLSRVAGFLFGSDMTYVVAQEASAPGQIPIGEARAIANGLLRLA